MRNFTLLKIKNSWFLILVFSVLFIATHKLDFKQQVLKTAICHLDEKTNQQFLNHLKVKNYWCTTFCKHQDNLKFSKSTKVENFKIQANHCSLKKDTNLKFVNYV